MSCGGACIGLAVDAASLAGYDMASDERLMQLSSPPPASMSPSHPRPP